MPSRNPEAPAVQVFNTPLESGIRSAALLLAVYPAACDLQRLVQYDYLIVHSGDVQGGPSSIHPATPNRSGELLVRRRLVEAGLDLMTTRLVVQRMFSSTGIGYIAGEYAVLFLNSVSTEYVRALRERAAWIADRFQPMQEPELASFMREHWAQWGSEFVRPAFVEASDE